MRIYYFTFVANSSTEATLEPYTIAPRDTSVPTYASKTSKYEQAFAPIFASRYEQKFEVREFFCRRWPSTRSSPSRLTRSLHAFGDFRTHVRRVFRIVFALFT